MERANQQEAYIVTFLDGKIEKSQEKDDSGNALHKKDHTLHKEGWAHRKEGQKHLGEEHLESKHTLKEEYLEGQKDIIEQ